MKINIHDDFSYSRMEKVALRQFIKDMTPIFKDENLIKSYIHKFAQVPEGFCEKFDVVVTGLNKCFFTDCFVSRSVRGIGYEVVCMFMASATFYSQAKSWDATTRYNNPTFAMVEGYITFSSAELEEDSIECRFYRPYFQS